VRLGALGALALGYVLGARAGRDRYEEIRQLASLAAERLESYGSSGSLASRVSQTPSRGDGDVSGA
jgi:type II secretory pathway pseudopilin PulG